VTVKLPIGSALFLRLAAGNHAPGCRHRDVVGDEAVVSVAKQLNRKQDGSLWLEGIQMTARQISYLPTDQLSRKRLDRLRTGDYLGIYSPQPGLDVSHTGIVIRESGRVWLRDASSQADLRRVVESELPEYLVGKPAVVVYRSR